MGDEIENQSHRKIFRDIALLGPALFLESLIPPDKLSDYVHFNRNNSRNFLLLQLLTEVQKVGFAFERWNEYLDRDTKRANNNIETQVLDSLIDEQSLWQRKLLEGLVLLINFASTNNLVFYYHLLLLQELQHYRGMMNEQEDFFQHGNALTKKTIDFLSDRIKMVENEIGDLSKCWYLSSTKKVSARSRQVIASLRMQLKAALKVASVRERKALGYTYSFTYGETSGNIHFTATRRGYANIKERFSFGLSQCGLLSTAIIKRAHDLTSMAPKGINALLARTDCDRQPKGNALVKRLEVGDFVLANGPFLGEIVDCKTSAFGYESYRIKYLADSPIEGVDEAWFPSVDVQLYTKKSEMLEELHSQIEKDLMKEGSESPPFTVSEMLEAMHEAVIEVWVRGVGAYMKRVATPRRVGDRGLGYIPEN